MEPNQPKNLGDVSPGSYGIHYEENVHIDSVNQFHRKNEENLGTSPVVYDSSSGGGGLQHHQEQHVQQQNLFSEERKREEPRRGGKEAYNGRNKRRRDAGAFSEVPNKKSRFADSNEGQQERQQLEEEDGENQAAIEFNLLSIENPYRLGKESPSDLENPSDILHYDDYKKNSNGCCFNEAKVVTIITTTTGSGGIESTTVLPQEEEGGGGEEEGEQYQQQQLCQEQYQPPVHYQHDQFISPTVFHTYSSSALSLSSGVTNHAIAICSPKNNGDHCSYEEKESEQSQQLQFVSNHATPKTDKSIGCNVLKKEEDNEIEQDTHLNLSNETNDSKKQRIRLYKSERENSNHPAEEWHRKITDCFTKEERKIYCPSEENIRK